MEADRSAATAQQEWERAYDEAMRWRDWQTCEILIDEREQADWYTPDMGCAACQGDPEALDLHVCGRETAAQPQRDPACVERWPECESGAYDPRCCRFPKSCSCTSYPPDESPAATVAFEERHAHNMHVLGLIRDEPAWALARILRCEALEARRHYTRRMLQALDIYWFCCEGMPRGRNPRGSYTAEDWWGRYEKYRALVESAVVV